MKDVEKMVFSATFAFYWQDGNGKTYSSMRASESVADLRAVDISHWKAKHIGAESKPTIEQLTAIFNEVTR